MRWAATLAIAACGGREPIASCDDDLRGVYAAGAERWMVLDHGATLEAYPLFPDAVAADPGRPTPPEGAAATAARAATAAEVAGLEIAPRVIDLERTPAGDAGAPAAAGRDGEDRASAAGPTRPAGTVRRRYLRGTARCEARVPVYVARCAGDTLELVIAEPSPPIAFSPCAWPPPGAARVVRWLRE